MASEVDPLVVRARLDCEARLGVLRVESRRFSADELTLLGRLLDEFDRKSKAWRKASMRADPQMSNREHGRRPAPDGKSYDAVQPPAPRPEPAPVRECPSGGPPSPADVAARVVYSSVSSVEEGL